MTRITTVRCAWTLCAALLAAHAMQVSAQETGGKPAPTIKSGTFQALVSIEGRDNFLAYCAVCHGVSGKGDGPAVPALKAPVPDLTTITTRKGKFDRVAVERFIAGVDKVPPAHGSTDMPMWGPTFKSQIPEHMGTLRLQNLSKYLESLQRHGS